MPAPVPVEDPACDDAPPGPTAWTYACRRCRRHLFHSDERVPHDASAGAPGHKPFAGKGYHEARRQAEVCTSYFLDPDVTAWVAEGATAPTAAEGADVDDILCPNAACRAKLGRRAWQGAQCSCGQWVTPAFRIAAARVDEFPVPDAAPAPAAAA